MDTCSTVSENTGNTNGSRIGSWLPAVGILGGLAGFGIDTYFVSEMSYSRYSCLLIVLMLLTLLADIGYGFAAGRMLRNDVNNLKSKGDILLATILHCVGTGVIVALVNLPFLWIAGDIDDGRIAPIALAIGGLLGLIVALPLSGILILCARKKLSISATPSATGSL